MQTIEGVVGTEPARVFAVLADGWSFPNWVVGVTHVRDVEPDWPAVGSGLHHTLGVWPAVHQDRAEVLEVDPGQRMVIRSRLGALGSVRIEIALRPVAEGTAVTLREFADAGLVRRIPRTLLDLLIRARNTESLRRLRTVAETRTDRSAPVPSRSE